MTNHVHIVVMRPKYRIEYVVNQLKGAATAELKLKKTPWTRKGWNVFLDEEDALPAAIKYVESNPIAAGLPPQRWGFVTPLSDLGNIDDWLSGGTT